MSRTEHLREVARLGAKADILDRAPPGLPLGAPAAEVHAAYQGAIERALECGASVLEVWDAMHGRIR